jgi:hypothetical protein
MAIDSINNNVVPSAAEQYLPEPATQGVGAFGDVLTAVGKVAGNAASSATGGLLGGDYSDLTDIVNGNSDFKELLGIQIAAQRELQAVSMVSNVEKSKHEAQMAAVRNIRVS